MAYRYTDTNKWTDNWFCDLKATSKLLFLYLCDLCDLAGFMEINEKKIGFDLVLGKQEVERGLRDLDGRLLYSIDRKYIYIRNFIKHQKNLPLNQKNPAHRGIIRRLEGMKQLFGFQSRMAAIAVHVPNSFKYLLLRENNAGIGSKKYKGTVFKAGKTYFLPVHKYPVLVLSYFQSRKR